MKVCQMRSRAVLTRQRPSLRIHLAEHTRRSTHRCMAMETERRQGDTDAPFGPLPAELQVLYDETTKNMVELNRARMKALEDLRLARQVIAQLEAENTDLKTKPGPSSNGKNGKAATLEPPMDRAPQMAAPPMAAPSMQAPVSMPPQPARQAPTTTITLQYYSGWDKAFLHYMVDGKSWTSVPGERMDHSAEGYKTKTVFGKSMEFVLNNGGNDWDMCDPYTNPCNYRIRTPGVYRLKNGKLDKLSS